MERCRPVAVETCMETPPAEASSTAPPPGATTLLQREHKVTARCSATDSSSPLKILNVARSSNSVLINLRKASMSLFVMVPSLRACRTPAVAAISIGKSDSVCSLRSPHHSSVPPDSKACTKIGNSSNL